MLNKILEKWRMKNQATKLFERRMQQIQSNFLGTERVVLFIKKITTDSSFPYILAKIFISFSNRTTFFGSIYANSDI